MIAIESAHAVVAVAPEHGVLQFIVASADEMAHRVATERVASEQENIDGEHNRADADSKVYRSCGIREPESFPDVIGEKKQKEDGEV